MLKLKISKWGSSLAVRLLAIYIRQNSLKQSGQLLAEWGTDGTLRLSVPMRWNRKDFAHELALETEAMQLGSGVIKPLRRAARF